LPGFFVTKTPSLRREPYAARRHTVDAIFNMQPRLQNDNQRFMDASSYDHITQPIDYSVA
jgi:hypothetical protein